MGKESNSMHKITVEEAKNLESYLLEISSLLLALKKLKKHEDIFYDFAIQGSVVSAIHIQSESLTNNALKVIEKVQQNTPNTPS